jgi:hypothetical protein
MRVERSRVLVEGWLAVEFFWHDDRFGHRVWLAHQVRPDLPPLLESLEGTPDEAWPPSPPLQSVDINEQPDGRKVAYLVGMAGKSHWSASMELDPLGESIRVDVACRVPAFWEGMLGSRYRVARLHPAGNAGHVVVPAADQGPTHGLRILSDGGASESAFRMIAPDTLAIEPSVPISTNEPRTIRWRYTIERTRI